jgi:ABC-type nickel/cobalt efflux system permease component RcnA
LIWPLVVWAHPLGNFTINRYSRLVVTQTQIKVHYIVDMAEIPAIAERQRIDKNGDGQLSQDEQREYLGQQVYGLLQNLQLQANGQSLEMVPFVADLTFPEGQGGLLTVRLAIDFIATLSASQTPWQVAYQDNNYAERRLGWQEIIVQAEPGVTLLESTAPSEDVSQELQNYPQELLANPLQVRQASFQFEPTGDKAPLASVNQAPIAQPSSPASQTLKQSEQLPITNNQLPITDSRASDPFAELITLPILGPWALLLTLAAAFGWGAMHAFSPGHGKTVVAAYLVGTRGTVRHALFLGLTTTLTHTAGVFALGGITLFISQFILPEQLYPWLGVLSGLLVVILGLSLLVGRWRQFRAGSPQHHHHHDHDHDHPHHHPHDDHDHHHPHGHSHLPPGADDTPVTWRSLLALGVSGGLLPCPSALVVMLSAIALGRIGLGLLLIVVFSLGLASVLTATGLLFVYAGRLFNRLPTGASRLVTALPAVSALIVTLLGIGITVQALSQTGLLTI